VSGATWRWLSVACLAVGLAAGCFAPNSVICADGTICPPGSRCDGHNRCQSGSGWSPTTFFNTALGGVWASGPNDAYAVGPGLLGSGSSGGTISHWDGTRWAPYGPGIALPVLTAVSGSSPDDVVVVGEGLFGSYDGVLVTSDGSIYTLPSTDILSSVWSNGRDDAFVASWDGETVVRWHPGTVSTILTGGDLAGPVGFPEGVWASGPNDLFVVGDRGLGRWDGASFSSAKLIGRSFHGVWGSGPGDVFAVGDGGTIVHWDGKEWTPMTSGTTSTLRAVSGSGAGDVFAGGEGVLLQLRGKVWEPLYPPGVTSIRGIAVTPARVFVVGLEGEVHLDRSFVTGEVGAGGATGAGAAGGAGGAAGTGGAPDGGGASDSGGSPALKPENIISDFEQADAATVAMVGNPPRNGDWYTYNDDSPQGTDSTCVQTPPGQPQSPNGQWVPYGGEVPPGGVRPGATGLRALHGLWRGCGVWGAGVGANLNWPVEPDGGVDAGSVLPLPYDVSPFAGVTFWAMGSAISDTALRIKLTMTDEIQVEFGGRCVDGPTLACNDDWGERFDLPADGTWKQFTVRWSDPGFHQEGWGTPFSWDPKHVLGIQIQSAVPAVTYDFWIDDLYFIN
jgi:hypothetical protein